MGIILASSSPRRKKILQKLGYSFEIEVPNVDENNINDLNPIDYVIDASMRKGLKVHQSFPTDYILSGDTIIEFENQIIGKPESNIDAINTLRLLSAKHHFVISALTLTSLDDQITIFDSTKVSFKSLTDDIIRSYVSNFNVLDKAGSYNVEDAEEYFIKNIDGCYNNIVGFPEKKFIKSTMKSILDKI
ncbi:MAG: nucleoside triphosphate pyrophosphatase [Candidatus Neomarinimicrobiota bacterium]|tara:strand:+ start:54 stop:620 length:567 start_codon:yes stop_codon:yes gene_type:complete